MELLTPIQIGSIEVRNRVVSTGHGAFLDFYRPGEPGDRYIGYQQRRAQGGTGLIILQPMHVHRSSHAEGHYNYEPDDMAPKFRRIADALHRHGAKTVVQLFHFGAQFTSDSRDDLNALWSFSGTVSPEGEVSHEMTAAEIEEVVEGFVAGAVLAIESGMDGVELHAAHGYLLQQSMSPWANQRTDEWGDPFRFVNEIMDRIRAAVGREPVMGIRLAADDFVRPERGGLGVEGAKKMAAELVATGHLDYVNHSEGARSSHYARAIGSYRHTFGEFLPLTAGLRDAIDAAVPVVGVGKIPTPDLAEQAIVDGSCDLVGMTRAQIADPDLVTKLMAGDANAIRLCTGSNQGCVDRMAGGLPITCFQNPEVGQEHRLEPLRRVSDPRRVLVIGAGPGGLKAAEIAARRGHHVTVAEATGHIGGRLRAVEAAGAANNLLSSVSWLEAELEKLEVEILLRTEVDRSFVADFAPDAVVVATGARPDDGGLVTDGSIPVLSTYEAAAGTYEDQPVDFTDTSALVVDYLGTVEVALAAEMLASRGATVTMVMPHLSLGPFIGFTHRKDLLDLLPTMGCRWEPSTLCTGIAEGEATTRHVYTKEVVSRPFDVVVAGVPPKPRTEVFDLIPDAVPTLSAGDVVAPRSALHAFREGDRAGRQI